MDDQEAYQEWQKSVLKEVLKEVKAQSSVDNHFKYVRFVSKSKGKGRKRKHWAEVELVKYNGSGCYRSWEKFPFDVYATKVLPGWEEWKAIEAIQDELRSGGYNAKDFMGRLFP